MIFPLARGGRPALLRFCFLLSAVLCLSAQNPANAAVAYANRGNTATGTTSLSVAYPNSIAAGDLLVLAVGNKYPTNGPATPAGWTLVGQGSGGLGAAGADSGQVYSTVFVKQAAGTESGSLALTLTSANTSMARMFRYTKSATMLWDYAATSGVDNTAGTGWSVTGAANPGITAGDVVFVASAINGNRVTNWTEAISATGVTAWGAVTEVQDAASGTGDDMSQIASSHPVTTGTASAAPVYTMTGNNGTANANSPTGASIILRLREIPATTTLATGTDPAAATIAPGAAATDVDLFTLQTNGGTEAVTAVTVNLSTHNGIARLAITNNAGTELGFTTSPVTGSNTITVAGLSATTALTTFKVRVTPLSHALMVAPPGAAYAITAPVTAWAGVNTHTGSDTNVNALTIDNLSPAGATSVSGCTGNGKIGLNWTTSASGDFATTSGSVIYRWVAASAGSEVPAEGSIPAAGDANGTAAVACVISSAASTAQSNIIDGSGGSVGCTTTALTNGQPYTYKVFQKDTNGNYDVGVSLGTFTPATGASTFTSQTSGNWNTVATWTGSCGGGVPQAGDNVVIANGHTVTLDVNTPTLNDLTVNLGGTLTNVAANTLTLSGALNNAGTYSGGSGAVTLGGNFTNSGSYSAGSATTTLSGYFSNSGTFTADTGTWVFGGSVAQSITGATTFYRLTFNNAAGVAVANDVTASNMLTLQSGIVSTGSNILTAATACPGGVSFTSGWVAGYLRLTFPAGNVTCNYYVGSGSTYAPIAVNMNSNGGTLTGATIGNEDPNIATSGIDATKDANRYWILWRSGDTLDAISYGATFTFTTGDLDIGSTPTSFVVGKYAAGAWTLPTPVTALALSTGVSSLSGPLTGTTNFAVGEVPPSCNPPSDLTAAYPTITFTCECDNFGRGTLNPSTIFGGNWSTSTSSGSFGLPRIVNSGYLRLTDNSGSVATAATVPGTFPAAGNLISVEFRHYAYSGSGADGVALTLSDSALTPTPGAFGGSLGYAQKSNPGSDCTTSGGCPGFNGGWIGMAIDEYGNFSNNTEGRTGGTAPGFLPDSVSVRGSGSGQTGYPYLGGTVTLTTPHGVDNAGSATASYGDLYRIIVDARSYTWNGSNGSNTFVEIKRDTSGTGGSFSTLIPSFDAYAVNPAQAAVPANWRLSFTGSTGGATNIHEISGLKICAQAFSPPAGFLIQVDNLTPSTCTTVAAGKPIVTVKALDSNGNVVTTYDKTVTLSATLGAGGTGGASAAVWSLNAGNGTFTAPNQYTFVAADQGVAKFQLVDSSTQSVYITVTENGGGIASSLSTPVVFSGASFGVTTADTFLPGDVPVAGRPHLMTITRASACGTDTTYSGSKTLDGWYTPVSGDHPTGAVAPQLCAPNVAGTCLPTTGACQTLSIAPPSLSAASNFMPALTFSGGTANFCLVTADVGKYSVSLRDDSNIASPIIGSTTSLTVRPFALAVSGVAQGATSNPAGTASSGSKFIAAGDTFQATVGAYLWNSAADSNSDGTPNASPTLNQLTANGATPSYSWDTSLVAGGPYTPGAGVLGVLSPTTGLSGVCPSNSPNCFTSGVAIPTGLTYSEAGSFTLTAQATSFLNTSGTNLSAYMFDSAGNYQSAGLTVGRFHPEHFELASGSAATNACSAGSFTYMGQSFGVDYQLIARNKVNQTTTNYDNDTRGYPTVDPLLVAEDGAAANQGNDLTGRLGVTGTPKWVLGTHTVSSGGLYNNVTFARSTSVDGSFEALALGVKMVDTDGAVISSPIRDMNAASAGICTASTTPACDAKQIGSTLLHLRYGRLHLANSLGSERLPLAVYGQVEYFNGSGWTINADDNCTTLSALGGPAAGLPLTPSGSTTARCNIGALACTVANGAACNAAASIAAGSLGLCLTAPNAAGYVDFSFAPPAWLLFPTMANNVAARATFGIYKGNNRVIYRRERY